MFFHPNQWEFKCLVHVNTKQNISRAVPSLTPSLLISSVISLWLHGTPGHRGVWREKWKADTLEAGNFTHMLLWDFHMFYANCHFICFLSVTLDLSLTFCDAFLTTFSGRPMWRPTGDRMKTKRNRGWLWRIEGLRTDCKAHWGNVAGMLGYINKKKKIMNKNKNMWCWFNWHALGRVGFISCHWVGEGGLPPPLSGVKLKFASSFKIPVDTWHSNS